MKLKIKKLTETATIPKLTRINDGNQVEIGIDLVVDRIELVSSGKYKCYSGIAIEPPDGYFMALYPRSSVHKHDSALTNSVGIIDPSYRGDVSAVFEYVNLNDGLTKYKGQTKGERYKVGDRFAQLVLHKDYTREIEIEEVLELSETERGDGGFGSTGQ